jgi:hypothetical protein
MHRLPMTNPPAALKVTKTPPILLVNSTHGPSDSYVWAAGFARQLRTGRLLTRDGDGHTSYFLPGQSQTRDAIDSFLVDGVLPPLGTIYPD